MIKTAVITGGSSGIGRETAKLLSENGFRVFEFSRSGEDEGKVRHLTVDVTDEAQVALAMETVFAETGRLDLLVNNAGMGISGAVEFTELEDAKRIFDVNFFGVLLCSKQALKYLRQTPGSQIINISSVAAVFSIPYQAFYSATKAAQNCLTLSLASELRGAKIRVNAVMPGDVKTGFTAARKKNETGGELYGKSIEKAVSVMEKDEQGGMSPAKVAETILKISRKKYSGKIKTVGEKYKAFVVLGKVLPTSFANRLVAKLYS